MRDAPGIYVHLPFCPYICPYCDFAKLPHRRSSADEYLRALHAEMMAYGGGDEEFATVFLGGGTPNTYAAPEIGALLDLLRERFPGPRDRETTIEVNPELVQGDDLRAYVAAGVTRLSIGVQSFVPAEIAVLGRKHTAEQVRSVVSWARAAGVRSVSIDLIFAVPGQTPDSWRASLEAAVALEPDHLSAYGLTVEAGTPYEGWRRREPQAFMDDAAEAELYGIAMDALEGAGFEQYEISNFSRPGHRCAHNENYWRNGEYVGLGVGAASSRDGVRSVHTRDLRAYVAAQGRAIPGEAEELQGAQRVGEAVMLALRTARGLVFAEFNERYGIDVLQQYAPAIERHCSDGLLEVEPTHARLTRAGRFVANTVCADFL